MTRRTIEVTTQRRFRTILYSILSRRFQTNDYQLRYRRLLYDILTNTVESKIILQRRKNKYSQVFTTNFSWTRVYSMQKKSDAHEGLYLMAKRDGVPNVIVMDRSKEQGLETFCKNYC